MNGYKLTLNHTDMYSNSERRDSDLKHTAHLMHILQTHIHVIENHVMMGYATMFQILDVLWEKERGP